MLHEISRDRRDKQHYWDEFYASSQAKQIAAPSQFASFVLQEASGQNLLIEIGCGTGRDSLFFARHGLQVLGLDASHSAIAHCNSLKAAGGIVAAAFHCAAIGSAKFSDALKFALAADRDAGVIVYARFLLHAITEEEEDILLGELGSLSRAGDLVAFEFRTVRDASGTKTTDAHYRRFVEPSRLFTKAVRNGFSVAYSVEGFGFAKYREDDAYVARCILTRD